MELTISLDGILTALTFCFYALGSIAFILIIKIALLLLQLPKKFESIQQIAAVLRLFSRRKKNN